MFVLGLLGVAATLSQGERESERMKQNEIERNRARETKRERERW